MKWERGVGEKLTYLTKMNTERGVLQGKYKSVAFIIKKKSINLPQSHFISIVCEREGARERMVMVNHFLELLIHEP